jgi:hypothetical protein
MTPEQYQSALEDARSGAVRLGLAFRELSAPGSPLLAPHRAYALASLERISREAAIVAELLAKLEPPPEA